MGHTVHNDPIPTKHMQNFIEILSETGGRFLNNPIEVGGVYLANYRPGDYKKQIELYQRLTTTIKEADKTQRWRQIFRRVWKIITF